MSTKLTPQGLVVGLIPDEKPKEPPKKEESPKAPSKGKKKTKE